MEGGDFLTGENISIVGLLIVAIITGFRGDWVSKKTVEDMKKGYEERLKYEKEEKEIYRNLYIESLRTNRRAIDAVATTVEKIQ